MKSWAGRYLPVYHFWALPNIGGTLEAVFHEALLQDNLQKAFRIGFGWLLDEFGRNWKGFWRVLGGFCMFF